MLLKKISCYLILSLLLITSCSKDVENLKLPDFEAKLLLSAFVSPDLSENVLNINCHTNNFGKYIPPEPPGKVTVQLSDEIREFIIDTALHESSQNKIHILGMPLTYGNKAYIKIITDRGLIAEAQCRVPVKRDFHIEVDTTREIIFEPPFHPSFPPVRHSKLSIKVSANDFPGEDNYYRLLISGKSFGSPGSNELLADYNLGDNVFSDKSRDGKKINLRTINCKAVAADSLFNADSSFLYIYLLNTNKDYYDFHKSLITSWDAGEGNPFSEPAPLHSNVSNGIGIFAAYTIDSLIFRIK